MLESEFTRGRCEPGETGSFPPLDAETFGFGLALAQSLPGPLFNFSAFLGAVVNPILMSPFAYPLWTWSTPVRYCTYITLLFYSFVAAYSVCSCVWHERYRPFSWVGVALFYALGWLYIGWHALHRCAARTPPPPAPLSSRRVLGGGQHPGVAVAPVVTRRALKTLPGSVFPP